MILRGRRFAKTLTCPIDLIGLKSPQTVASDSLGAAAGAQQPQCTDRYLRIASTAGRGQRGAQ